MKYNEDKILEDVLKYIKGTYSKHYSVDKDFSLSNAIKYLCRYGKKDGKNKMDLYKAIHYIVLLISSEKQ